MQKEFVKNVLTLMTGTALGQAIALLLSPIITRLFDPSDFSIFEQYALLLSLLTIVVSGRYEAAIMHPKQREDARHVLGLSLRIALWVCIPLLIVFAAMGMYTLLQESINPLYAWLWTLPLALYAIAVFNGVNYWFSREKKYGVAATSRLLYSAAGEPVKLILGWIRPSVGGLISGTVLGHAVAAIHGWLQFKKNEPKGIRNLSPTTMRSLALEHKDYPLFSLPAGLLNNLAQWAHVAVFIFFYGEKAIIPIGFIALSRRIFFNPLGILSYSYSQVFYQRISAIDDPLALRNFFIKNLIRMLAFASLMIVVVQMLPSNSLGIIFGEKWSNALVYLKILSFWYALNFAISTLSFIFNRLQLQWYTLVADIIHFLSVIVAFWWAWNAGWDELAAVKAMVVAKVIFLLFNGAAVLYFLQRNISRHA